MGLQSAATGLFRFSGTLTSGVGQQGVSGGQHIEGSPRKGPVDLTVEQTVAASYGKEITDSVERRLEAWMASPTFGSGETRNYWFDDDGFHYNNLSIIASYASSSNIDSIWHDDTANAWNFCSDTTLRAAGNSTLVGAKSSMGLGTALLPSFFFTGDPNTGVYSAGADSFGVTVGGVVRRTVTTGSETATLVQLGPAGAAAAPTYSFSTDPNTGVYSAGADSFGVTVGGVVRRTVTTGSETATLVQLGPDGAVGAPTYSFTNSTTTGIYSDAANSMSFATSGTQRLDIDSGGIKGKVAFQAPYGSAGAPGVAFDGDSDTGMYRLSANRLGFSCGGAFRMLVDPSGLVTMRNSTDVGTGSAVASIMQIGVSGDATNAGTNDYWSERVGGIIDGLEVHDFDWIDGDVSDQIGLFAQQAIDILPDTIVTPPGVEPESNDEPEQYLAASLDYSKIVPILVAECQFLRQRLNSLESSPDTV